MKRPDLTGCRYMADSLKAIDQRMGQLSCEQYSVRANRLDRDEFAALKDRAAALHRRFASSCLRS
jgi:hypothetical protein